MKLEKIKEEKFIGFKFYYKRIKLQIKKFKFIK